MDKKEAILRAKERAKVKRKEDEEAMRKGYVALRQFIAPVFECAVCEKKIGESFVNWKTKDGNVFSSHVGCQVDEANYVTKRFYEEGKIKEAYVRKDSGWEAVSNKEMKRLQQLSKMSDNFF
jgi:hypothetical protein